MPTAIMLREHGGPEVLRAEEVAVGRPGPGELRLQQTAIGVNFHDCYVRSGLYRTLALPGVPGIEAAGVVEAVGPGVADFVAGDRVAYVDPGYGAYASARLLPARLAVKLPDAVSDQEAAAVLVKGLTAELLAHEVHPLRAGDTILVQAAAGGVGRLLCQLASSLGATVIGTAGSEAKAVVARQAGCAHTILYRQEDFVARVRELTDGQGVQVAYDSVGRDTFVGSLDCLAVRGHLVNFGQASGAVPAFEVARLAAGSFSLTRPIMFHYLARREELQRVAARLFARLKSGVLTAERGQAYPLAEAATAHAALESRNAGGPLLLLP